MRWKVKRQHKKQGETARSVRESLPYVCVLIAGELALATTHTGYEQAEIHVLNSSVVVYAAWATVAQSINKKEPIVF
jgi:hypothetical protein